MQPADTRGCSMLPTKNLVTPAICNMPRVHSTPSCLKKRAVFTKYCYQCRPLWQHGSMPKKAATMTYKKILDWTFDGCQDPKGRYGWGVIAERWGDYDVYGLQGSIYDGGGYAFFMNSVKLAWPFVPMVKYEPQYADAIGKWMLNLGHACRLFYPGEIDDQHQWLPEMKDLTHNNVAYEGLRKTDCYNKESLQGVTPVALAMGLIGNPNNPPESMFSLYSTSPVGILGAMVDTTRGGRYSPHQLQRHRLLCRPYFPDISLLQSLRQGTNHYIQSSRKCRPLRHREQTICSTKRKREYCHKITCQALTCHRRTACRYGINHRRNQGNHHRRPNGKLQIENQHKQLIPCIKRFSLPLLCLMTIGIAAAQQKTPITGNVQRRNLGEPLLGVSIRVDGTSIGTIVRYRR